MNQLRKTGRGFLVIAVTMFAVQATAHTLFIKPDTFYFEPDQEVVVSVLNGTFGVSEANVKIERTRDVSIIAPDASNIDVTEEQWSNNGKITNLSTSFGQTGNYVIGIGTLPAMIRMTPEKFSSYLHNEGLDDDVAERKDLGEEGLGAAERYAKFAKSIVQVGDEQSENYGTILGYPVEIVPLVNPYSLSSGDTFRARILKDGQPLAGALIYAGYEAHNGISAEDTSEELVRVRSDDQGEIEFVLADVGPWYVRFIDIERTGDKEHWYSGILVSLGAEEPRIPYESRWATLTFEIR
jgi:uncharacterized GH25 family protein